MKGTLRLIIASLFVLAVGLWFYKHPHHLPARPSTNPPPTARADLLPTDRGILRPPAVFPNFIAIDKYRESEEGTVYGDIMSHSGSVPFGDSNGRGTNAHETTHGINSD